MHKLAGVLLHVEPLDADGFEVGVLAFFGHLHLNPAVLGDRFVELGDLVVLGQVGIEVLLAVELAVLSNLQVQGHGGLHRILEHLLVQHRQGARQATHHRVDVGVGLVTKGGGRVGKNLAVGAQLHVGFQANHGLPCRLSCCCARHLRSPIAVAWPDPMDKGPQLWAETALPDHERRLPG